MRPPTRHGRWWGSLAKPADKRTAGRSPASRCAQGSPRPFACTAPLLPGRGGQAERSPPCRATARTTVPEDYAFYAQSWIRFANDRRWVGRPQAGTRSAGRRGERVAHANPPPRARRRRWPPRRTSCVQDGSSRAVAASSTKPAPAPGWWWRAGHSLEVIGRL